MSLLILYIRRPKTLHKTKEWAFMLIKAHRRTGEARTAVRNAAEHRCNEGQRKKPPFQAIA